MLTVQGSRSPGHTQSSVVPVTTQRPLSMGANSPQEPSSPEYTVMSCLPSCSHRGARSSTTPANFWNPNSPKWVRIWPWMGVSTHCPSGDKGHLSKNPVGEEHEAAKGSARQQPVQRRSHCLGCLTILFPLRFTAGTI